MDLPRQRFPELIETVAFFIIMEAVVNAAKHARVDCVEVRGRVRGRELAIEIRDEGVGGADPRRGTGLRNMAERLAALDGTITVSSPPRGGTVIQVVLPCE